MKSLALIVSLFCLSCVKQTPVVEDVHDASSVVDVTESDASSTDVTVADTSVAMDVTHPADVTVAVDTVVVEAAVTDAAISVDSSRTADVVVTDASTRDGG